MSLQLSSCFLEWLYFLSPGSWAGLSQSKLVLGLTLTWFLGWLSLWASNSWSYFSSKHFVPELSLYQSTRLPGWTNLKTLVPGMTLALSTWFLESLALCTWFMGWLFSKAPVSGQYSAWFLKWLYLQAPGLRVLLAHTLFISWLDSKVCDSLTGLSSTHCVPGMTGSKHLVPGDALALWAWFLS
jgi:hypothetical protein